MAILFCIAVWRGRSLIVALYKEHLSDRTLLSYLAIFIGGLVLGETLFEKTWFHYGLPIIKTWKKWRNYAAIGPL